MDDYLIIGEEDNIVGEEKFIMKINEELKFFKILYVKFTNNNNINKIYKIIDTGNISHFDFTKKIGKKNIRKLTPKIGYFGSDIILYFCIENYNLYEYIKDNYSPKTPEEKLLCELEDF